jgi:hypothetical protein
MANFELQLNSRMIREGKTALQTILNYGIGLDDFRSSEGKGMFSHLLAYYNDAASSGSLPGINAAVNLFPNFELCDDVSMATEKLCEELRRQRQVLEMRETASYLAEMCEIDPMKAAADVQVHLGQLIELGVGKNTDIHFHNTIDEILFDYEQVEAGIDLSVMKFPWPLFQMETMGLQHDDYVVFYGRPKSKKSWVLAFLIAWAYLQGKNIVAYTKEMTPKNILKRVAACLARIPYREFRQGRLASSERDTLFSLKEYIDDLRMSQRLVILSAKDVSSGGDTVPWLRSKIEKHKPDLQFVDGLYLMSPSDGRKNMSREERMTGVSRQYRQLILDTGVPGIATLQANRKAAGHHNAELDEIAYSDAIGQDATIAVRVIAERLPIEDKNHNTIILAVGGSREFELPGVRIGGTPAIDFEERGPLNEKEVTKAKETDTDDAVAGTNGKPKGKGKKAAKDDEPKMSHADMLNKQLDSVLPG